MRKLKAKKMYLRHLFPQPATIFAPPYPLPPRLPLDPRLLPEVTEWRGLQFTAGFLAVCNGKVK